MILEFISSKIIWSVAASVSAAQIVKWLIHYRRTRKWDWRWLFRDAGMPSAHTATVTALAVSVFIIEGVTTLSLAVFVLSAIVVRDVIGDKIFATKQENALNNVIKKIEHLLQGDKVEWRHFTGHTITEVVAGFMLALIISLTIHYYL